MQQLITVYIVLAAAVAYAGYRIWKSLRAPKGGAGSRCAGCPGCALMQMKNSKEDARCSEKQHQNTRQSAENANKTK